jgi:hypothetical protein
VIGTAKSNHGTIAWPSGTGDAVAAAAHSSSDGAIKPFSVQRARRRMEGFYTGSCGVWEGLSRLLA